MVYATNIAAFNRKVIHVVKIVLDRCGNTFGNAPCTATGTVCHYAFPTCKDQPNFTKTSRSLWFQSFGQPLLTNMLASGIRPYLLDETLSPLSQKIDPERALTEHARMEFEFLPDWGSILPLPPMDHDKGTGKYDTSTVGEYWRLLWARNPNYNLRQIFYYHGFEGDSEGDLQLKWWGVIENVELLQGGGCRITATDKLKQVKHSTVPNAVRSTNVTTLEMDAGGTEIEVTDASEFRVFSKDIVLFDTNADMIRMPIATLDDDYVVYPITALAGAVVGLTWAATPGFYFTTYGTNLYKFRPGDSAWQLVGDTTLTLYDLAWSEVDQVLYASSGTRLYTIDENTGAATDIGDHGVPGTIRGLCINTRTNQLIAIQSQASDYLFIVDKLSGAVDDQLGTIGTNITPTGLCYDEIEDCCYTLDSSPGAGFYRIFRCELDTVSGGGSAVGTLVNQNVQLSGLEIFHLNARSFIKIEDSDANSGNEYRELLGVDTATNTLYVAPEPLNGTDNYPHGLGKKVSQVAAILDWSDTTWQTGMLAVDAVLHVLTDWIGISHADIDLDSFWEERRLWVPGDLVRGVVEKPTEGDKVLQWIRDVIRAHLWVNESQQIEFRTTHPVNEHTDTITEIDEDENVLADPAPSLDANTDKQVTRVVVHFDKQGAVESKTTEADEYALEFTYGDAALEHANYMNDELTHTIFAPFVYREVEAKAMAVRYLRRFGRPPAKYKFSLDPKDYSIKTGDVIRITSPDFMELDGTNGEADLEVLQKQEGADGMIHLECMDTRFDRNYGFIGHAGAADWGAASATEKLHAYIGGAEQPDGKCLMSDGSEGYAIY